jgi:hypothetical protein
MLIVKSKRGRKRRSPAKTVQDRDNDAYKYSSPLNFLSDPDTDEPLDLTEIIFTSSSTLPVNRNEHNVLLNQSQRPSPPISKTKPEISRRKNVVKVSRIEPHVKNSMKTSEIDKINAEKKIEKKKKDKGKISNFDNIPQKLREESTLCNRDMLVIWKKEMEDNNDPLIVPRTPFVIRKKLRRGLRNCLNEITQMLEVADMRINNRFEFDNT